MSKEPEYKTCPVCNGRGMIKSQADPRDRTISEECARCDGAGIVKA